MRRLAMLLALLGSTVIAFVAPAPVSAGTVVVEPEPVARIFAAPTSPQTTGPSSLQPPYNEVPWGLDRIDQRAKTGDNSYSFTNSGTSVDVYVVDTGINATHPEFDARVKDGWSYRSHQASLDAYNDSRLANISNPSTGIPVCPSNATTQQYTPSTFDAPVSIDTTDKGREDNNGHGTHVAGSVGGNYTGVAKDVNLIPVRVLDSCGRGNLTMIYYGLQFVKTHHVAGKPAVVNLSLGFSGVVSEIDTLIAQLISEGVVVVVAAGNIENNTDLGDPCATTPAGTAGTISVGSSNETDNESYFSYYGQCVDIFAPGESILSTWPKNGASLNTYYLDTGTSMAAPHIAGAVARFVQDKTITSAISGATWSWLKLNATCNAISYYTPTSAQPSRINRPKTPNRLLAVGAPATIPCAPASVTTTAGNGSVSVVWNPVASDNGSDTLDYTATLTPGNQTCIRTASQDLSCEFTGLSSGITYTVAVHARNALGNGPALSSTSGRPQAVTGLAASVNANVLDVSWTRGAGDESGVTYTATASPGGATCSTTSTTCSIGGLALGTEYTITVVGVNILGTGTSVSIIKKFVRAPLPVTKLAAVVLGNGLEVSWDQAAGDTSGITYTATAMPGGASCTSAATKCSIAGLTVGTEYTVTVVGVNAIGAGAGTSLVKIFSRVPIAVTNLVATAAENALDISWERAGGESASTMYTATATPGDFTCTSTTSSCSIFPLVNGTEYTVSVFGSNQYGDGAATSVKGTPDGAPEVPLTVLSVVNKRTITLSWPAVTSTADVTYVVSSRPGNLMCTTELTTCAVTGLSYGVDYSFTITTRSSTGLTSSAALVGSARPGFKIKKSVVKRGSSTSLTNILVPLSTGKRTWSETGPCSIRGTRLIAPKRATKCVLILKVAKKGSYPAMSTRLKVTVK